MAINVNDMELPYVPAKIIKSDLDAYDQFLIGIDAREKSWIATTNLSYIILDHDHSFKMSRDTRWHNGLSLLSDLNPHFDEKTKEGRRKIIINLEGDDHLRLKRIIGPVFSPKNADSLRPDMEKAINEIIDAVIESGECDLQKDIFNKYPSYIITKILGIPNSDWEEFSRWADITFSTFAGNYDQDPEEVRNTQKKLDKYTQNLVYEKRNNLGNDLVSMLITAESDGEKLTDSEIVHLIQAVLMGGLDTTKHQLGLISIMLADQPELIDMLSKDINVQEIIEESIRLDGVFKYVIRVASEDIEYNGVLFPKGTIISPALMVGNYDESTFNDAGSFMVDRPNRKGATLSFGAGIHYCLGASIARAQIQEAMRAIAKRMPDYQINGDVVYKKAYEAVWGARSLPVKFTPGNKNA
jgi:cytochrome P450